VPLSSPGLVKEDGNTSIAHREPCWFMLLGTLVGARALLMSRVRLRGGLVLVQFLGCIIFADSNQSRGPRPKGPLILFPPSSRRVLGKKKTIPSAISILTDSDSVRKVGDGCSSVGSFGVCLQNPVMFFPNCLVTEGAVHVDKVSCGLEGATTKHD
jgi:hypothetical protein